MAGIFRCAPGLVKLIFGKSWQDTGLPECFQISKERIDRFKEPIKSSLQDAGLHRQNGRLSVLGKAEPMEYTDRTPKLKTAPIMTDNDSCFSVYI